MRTRPALAPPLFLEHLQLLFGLRLRLGFNRGTRISRTVAILGYVFGSVPALGLGRAAYALMHAPAIAQSPDWPPFILNLLCFVTSAVTCTWPVLSAGVDDHSELSRYAAFPLPAWRLLVSSTLASLAEPRALVFASPLVGAALGFVTLHRPMWPALAVAMGVQYFLLNACASRVGVHLVLQALRAPRSAELLGGTFVAFLVLCSLIPPVDTSWLTAPGGGVGALQPAVLRNAALALGSVPPGFFGAGLELLARGRLGPVLVLFVLQSVCLALGFGLAYFLLVRFHRGGQRTVGSAREGPRRPFARGSSLFSTLFSRELMDLWKNPRARLLASVPFILAILIKLLSARALLVFVVGERADAVLLGALGIYGTLVMASTFSQNAFAYDGPGMAVFLTAPVPLKDVLRAKNAVHAFAAAVVFVPLLVFYRLYFHGGHAVDFLATGLGAATLVLTVLAAGNGLSVFFPVKFHANLKRRDRLPFIASMLGVAAASVGSYPFIAVLHHATPSGLTPSSPLWLVGSVILAAITYEVSFPFAVEALVRRREKIFAAVTRD